MAGTAKLLHRALFAAAPFLLCVCATAQQIAFTWDDLPSHGPLPVGDTRVEIGMKIIQAMQAAHMPPAYGFMNGIHSEDEPASMPMLQEWRDAGLPLGNHTWSHMNLNQMTVAEWEADVLKNEPLLQTYMKGKDWHWLRYPNLAEGNTPEKRDEARTFLHEHGYKIAGVTMSLADYLYAAPYARCVAKKDSDGISQLEKSYLESADTELDYTRELAKTLFGHDISYVLLMHVGGLDARLMPRLLQLYRDKGVTFVSLEEAERDPFYKNDLDLSLPAAPDTLEGAARMRGMPLPTHRRPDSILNTICK